MHIDYAELHCLSNFSFLRGASHPEELVEHACALGYRALAITDECSLAGVVRAHVAAKEHGLHLLIGAEVRLEDGTRLVLLATDRTGYGNLSRLITRGRRRAPKGEYRLGRDDLADGLPGCLVLWVPGELDGTGQRPAANDEEGLEQLPRPGETAHWLTERFPDRSWIAVELHLGPDDAGRLKQLRELGGTCGLPLVAAGDVHMHTRSRRALQDLVTAIRLNTTVAQAGDALFPNGERHLRSLKRLAGIYPAELLDESVRIAGRCTFRLDELRYNYPEEAVPEGATPTSHLRRLTEEGLKRHWPEGEPAKVRALVEHELSVIAELDYEPYFLTVHDIVRFARSRGILCQGRGSAANSAVCYCLDITAVDPSRMEMLFERFVSKERDEPPDIDVDFEHSRREEVIQYIYERYGRSHAALAATVITYRTRSALRDAGRALGMSADQLDRLTGAFTHWDGNDVERRIGEAGFDLDNPVIRQVLTLAAELRGSPRHLSQHVGGMVMTRDPIAELVPVENAAMPTGKAGAHGHGDEPPDVLPVARTVIQWDKDDLEALGLMKVDCLALGMLSAIHHCFDLVATHRGRELSLATVPAEDPATYRMIQNADTVGVFQIESRAQMTMLPRLRPRTFYDLVVEVAIVRPGPIQGDMVHPYLRRRQGLEAVSYPGPEAESVLARTLGVPIFQEQVIKLAMVAAGFSAGEADQLRRAMASWRRKGTLARFEQKLREGMAANHYPAQFAEQIVEQLRGFGEYGFPESHAASFALLAYISAWLKCHEPAAFTCALLNSQPMGFYAPAQLVRDAREHGVEVRPVDVLESEWHCTLEPADNQDQPPLRLGLRMVKGLAREAGERIMTARQTGPFESVPGLARRAGLGRRELEQLAAAGALARLSGNRHQARWEVLGTEGTLPLFDQPAGADPEPALPAPTEGQDLSADYRHVGLTLGRHPLALLRDKLRRRGFRTTAEANARRDGVPIRVAGLVITRQRPGLGRTTFLTLEDEDGIANIIVWQALGERFRREVMQGRLLGIRGKVQKEGAVVHIVAGHLEDLSHLLGGLTTHSRDFC